MSMLQKYYKTSLLCKWLFGVKPTNRLIAPIKRHKKPIREIFFSTITVLLILCVSFIESGCSRNNDDNGQTDSAVTDPAILAIRDSIAAYHFGWAKSEITRRMAACHADSDKMFRIKCELMNIYYYSGAPDSVMEIARECMNYVGRKKASTQERREILLNAYQSLGAVYTQYISQPDSAVNYAAKVLPLIDSYDMSHKLMAYNNLADAYKYAGNLPKAVETYRRAILKADSAGNVDKSFYVPLYAGLAGCYTDLRNFEQSTYWWDKAASLWDYMTIPDRTRYFNNRGSDYYYRKEYPQSLRMFERLDSLCATNPDLEWDRLFGHVNMADVYLKMGRYDKAMPLIEETTDYFTRAQMNEAVMSYLYTQRMDALRQQGDYKAVEELIKAHPIPQGIRPDQAVLRLDFLRNYYTERGDIANALRYTRLYQQLEDSLRDERIRMKTEELKSRYERDETVMEQRVMLADRETRLMRTYALTGVALAVVLLLLIVIGYERNKRRQNEKRFRDNIIEMRMENIRNRITPHFIYNALNNEILARERGCDTSSQMPVLVNLLRRAQLLASDFCIPLDEELDFIRLYLDVESRSVGQIDYTLDVAQGIDIHAVMLPSMTIQIFVENAVKHAFKMMPRDATRRLVISVAREASHTVITVENNGYNPQAVNRRDSTGTGMRVVFQTIQMLNERNKDKINVNISQLSDERGESIYSVKLSIPDGFDFTVPSR